MEQDKFGCITCREFRTGGGQLVRIWCSPEDADKVLAAFKDVKNFEVEIPTTKQVKDSNGGMNWPYTRYDITRVKREGNCIEVLKIENPPDGRCGNILIAWLGSSSDGMSFFEFDTIENACIAFGELKNAFGRMTSEQVSHMQGCLRLAKCGIFKPWFYAVADQALRGDVVFPDTVREDEIFQFGRKFVVKDWHSSTVKTCVAVEQKVFKDYYGEKESPYRLVFWDDGTHSECWEKDRKNWPRPLDESYLWVQEAMDLFRELLSGLRKKFEIPFRDGSKFVGQWKSVNPKDKTWAGRYRASLILESGKKVKGEFNFEPTPEVPTVVDLLVKNAKEKGVKIKEIQSLARTRGGSTGRKWVGVF